MAGVDFTMRMGSGVTSPLGLAGGMALWRAYQRALAAHPWKVQVLTAGECFWDQGVTRVADLRRKRPTLRHPLPPI